MIDKFFFTCIEALDKFGLLIDNLFKKKKRKKNKNKK